MNRASVGRENKAKQSQSQTTEACPFDKLRASSERPMVSEVEPSRRDGKRTMDDIQVDGAYKPAYKELTKNAYSGYNESATVGTNQIEAKQGIELKNNSDKVLVEGRLGNECDSVSSLDNSSKNNGPGRIRTYDQWIMSPLLYR